jgi:protein gp37
MSATSKIEWTDASWNPVRGCSIVSKGCTNCYAMKQAHRFAGVGQAYEGLTQMTRGGPVWNGQVRLVPELLDWPLRRRKPSRVFVNSMSDLFHEDVPDEFILQVFDVIRQCQNGWTSRIGGEHGKLVSAHTFQILTKRPARMLDFCTRLRFAQNDGRGLYLAKELPHNGFNPMPALKNLWLGVSVEDQAAADERIPLLLQTPAAVRWISAEPLLGPLNLHLEKGWCRHCNVMTSGAIEGHCMDPNSPCFSAEMFMQDAIAWVVAGGESGPGARPSHPNWFRSLRDQCAAAGVPFFFKQWGAYHPAAEHDHVAQQCKATPEAVHVNGGREFRPAEQFRLIAGGTPGWAAMCNLGKRAAGRLLDGIEHNEYPASPLTTTKESP